MRWLLLLVFFVNCTTAVGGERGQSGEDKEKPPIDYDEPKKPDAPTKTPCGSITAKGTCQGGKALKCVAGDLQTTDCQATGFSCSFDPTAGAACEKKQDTNQAKCNLIGEAGQCNATDTGYQTCRNNVIYTSSCSANETCDMVSGRAACIAVDDCQGYDYNGACDGNTLKYCNGGELESIQCDAVSTCGGLREPACNFGGGEFDLHCAAGCLPGSDKNCYPQAGTTCSATGLTRSCYTNQPVNCSTDPGANCCY